MQVVERIHKCQSKKNITRRQSNKHLKNFNNINSTNVSSNLSNINTFMVGNIQVLNPKPNPSYSTGLPPARDYPQMTSEVIQVIPTNQVNSSQTPVLVKSIKGLLLNIRSIRNKFNELHSLINAENFDIIALTETFITSSVDLDGEYQIPNYKLFTKNRPSRGGGVAIYCKSNLNPIEINTSNDINVEHLCVQINANSNKTNINVIYRRPSQSLEIDTKMYDSLQGTINNIDTIILGDFNLPQIDWANLTYVESESERLISFVDNNFLHQQVTEPTRGGNILDLILTNQEYLVSSTSVREQLGSCDHNMIEFEINNQINCPKESIYVPNFGKANYDGLNKELDKLSLIDGHINEVWTNFKNQFLSLQNTYIPLHNKSSVCTHRPEWFSPKIGRVLRNRNKLYKIKKTTNDPNVLAQYNTARREVKKIIRQEKRNYEINVANNAKNDPKKFYKYINNKKHLKSGIGPLANDNGETISDNKQMADTFNEYFSSVFTSTKDNCANNNNLIKSNHKLPDLKVTEKQVLKKIEKMKINKSPGPDNFYPRIIKNVKHMITSHLTAMFNMSLRQGTMPQDWKDANVTPIYKKGCRKQPSNYRPISLTSVICKILESIIKDNIVKYLDKHNLIKSSQHGFSKNKSCLTNLIEFYHKLFHEHDRTKALDIIYLDFQKAFDKVPHDKLMMKVKSLGINGNVGQWIEDWLKNRRQRVVINGQSSDWIPVTSGVPQGSVLGPLLFIIYINDIDVGLNNTISKFADDTKIGSAVLTENDRLKLQQDLDKVSKWSEDWNMPFNINKCQLLQVGSLNNKYQYSIMNQQLESAPSVKDLGVIVSQNLKFSQQCIEASKKANKMLGFINRNFTYKSKDIILPLYSSLVRPHLEYAVQFWDPHLSKDIQKLESIQRRATKLIPNLRNKTYEERLRELNLFSLEKRRLRGKLIECFKILRGFTNMEIEGILTIAPELPTRGNGLKLRGHRVNLDVTKYFYTNDIVDKWNSLPENVVNSTSIDMFKNKLDRHLLATNIA